MAEPVNATARQQRDELLQQRLVGTGAGDNRLVSPAHRTFVVAACLGLSRLGP